jgi:hypothetical protein
MLSKIGEVLAERLPQDVVKHIIEPYLTISEADVRKNHKNLCDAIRELRRHAELHSKTPARILWTFARGKQLGRNYNQDQRNIHAWLHRQIQLRPMYQFLQPQSSITQWSRFCHGHNPPALRDHRKWTDRDSDSDSCSDDESALSESESL